MKNIFDLEGVELLDNSEQINIDGGFVVLTTIAAVCGIVYLAGEIAESAGRSYAK